MIPSDQIISSIEQLELFKGQHTAVFSGSFNPPHLGHLHVMECAVKHKVDYAMVFPHSFNWRKTGQLLPLNIRLEMLSLLMSESVQADKIFICHPELFHGLRENIEPISEAFGGKDYVHILVGGDRMSLNFAQYFKGFDHLVVQRGVDVESICRCVFDDQYHVFDDEYDASSTQVRGGSPLERKRMLGDRLFQFIEEHDYWAQLNQA
ncbi:MAG: adenylyltransferase/cytidyltransferase family protein [Methylococcales bacterium]|nr:adenylyltransferase/cytidyltransferase family protein [Methylococcales bacterium]